MRSARPENRSRNRRQKGIFDRFAIQNLKLCVLQKLIIAQILLSASSETNVPDAVAAICMFRKMYIS